MKLRIHGAISGDGRNTLWASHSVAIALALASLLSVGVTGMMPGIWVFNVSMIALPFALSSTSLRMAFLCFLLKAMN